MTPADLEEHRQRLLQLRKKILSNGLFKARDDLQVSTDDLPDETDLATNVIHQQVSFSIRNRELEKLRLVEMALQRIEDGQYGTCDECDEEIEELRLKNQPWASLCIIHAEEKERENSKYRRQGM